MPNPRKNIKAKQRRRARMRRRLKWWDGERRFTILNGRGVSQYAMKHGATTIKPASLQEVIDQLVESSRSHEQANP